MLTKQKYIKSKNTIDIIGISYQDFVKHIESKFTKGMTWDKLMDGQIHIDHIIPLSIAKTEEDLITLCHYTNLQPLWAKDNLIKNNKIIETQIKLAI